MYNASTIKTEFAGLIGWEQNDDQSGEQIGLGLTTTSSGRYFNGEHPQLTLDNLLSVSAEYTRLTFAFTAWSGATTYVIGDHVTSGGNEYTCLVGHINQVPPNATYWEVHKPFSDWLKRKTEAFILRAISSWVTLRLGERSAASILSKQRLYRESGDITLKDLDSGKFVGQEITPARSRNLNLNIRQIGLQFDTNENKTVYLFNSRQPAPIQTAVLAYTGSGGIQWFDVTGWDMEGEGVYYVGYDQDAIAGQSINGLRNYFAGRSGVSGKLGNNFFLTSPFSIPSYAATLWNPQEMSYSWDSNFGINLDITVSCDYTNLFVEQKMQFVDMIAKFVAMEFLRLMVHNPEARVNRNQTNVDTSQLLYEIDGLGADRPGGIKVEYDKALKAISLNYIELDRTCLPCKKRGSTWKLA